MENTKTVVAEVIGSLAHDAGKLFAQSEINAGQALELFAESVGTEPTYEVWERERLAWTNGFTEIKPKAKGDAAYQAFTRFKTRLVEAYGIDIPKSKSVAAGKKREERQAKQTATLQRYDGKSNDELHTLISQAYERQAKNPLGSDAVLKELKTVLKARTKDSEAETKVELKAKRDGVIKLIRACNDLERLDLIAEMLSEENEVSFITQ